MKWFVLIALATAVASALYLWYGPQTGPQGPAPLDPQQLQPGLGPRDYEAALQAEELQLHQWRSRSQRDPSDWLSIEGVAISLANRFSLRGDYADLAKADRLLDEALALAPWPSGPVLSRADVSLGVHRLDESEAALKRLDAWAVPANADQRDTADSLRCEIALQRGEPRKAARLCAQGADPGMRMRLANIATKTGQFAEAERILEDLLRKPRQPPNTLALLALQRASVALARGDLAAARRWSRAADRLFPGYWLAEAFVAQQSALEGDLAEASRRYRDLAAKTGNPDVLDAYAAVLQARGEEAEAREWIVRSRKAWDERMRLLPEAAATHFAEHLARNGEPEAALDLARSEYLRRPTATSAGNLAAMLGERGDPQAGLAILRETRNRGWKTAKLKAVESALLKALGWNRDAQAALDAARALNPLIDDPKLGFIYFDQD